jgi:hypothetical protein
MVSYRQQGALYDGLGIARAVVAGRWVQDVPGTTDTEVERARQRLVCHRGWRDDRNPVPVEGAAGGLR